MDKILNWFLRSSEDPEKTSLTIKGILVVGIGQVVSTLGSIGVTLQVQTIIHDVTVATTILGGVLTVIGMARKLSNIET